MSEFVNNLLRILEANCVSQEGLIGLLSIIVTLLIPISILTINTKQESFPLDNRIVFKKIFMYKNFIALIIPISFFLLFPKIKLIAFVLVMMLAILSIKVLVLTFNWLVGDKNGKELFKQKTRIEYLSEIKDEKEILNTWTTILQSENKFDNNGLLAIYLNHSKYMKNTKENWNEDSYWRLLRDNYNKIESNDIKDYKDLINKSLTYYSRIISYMDDKEHSVYERPPEALHQIAQIILEKTITSEPNSIEAYIYFDTVEKFIKSLSRKNQNAFLDIYLIDCFRSFVENDINFRDIWHGNFFNRIIIKDSNLDTKTSQVVMDSYYRSIIIKYVCRSTNPPDDIAKRIDYITQYIFKEINPITWFRIITFIMWPHPYNEDPKKDRENRIINWCKRDRNYGVFGRLDCSIFSIPETDKKTQQKILQEKITNDTKKEQVATYKTIVKFLNLSNFDCEPYLTIILKLKEKCKGNQLISERLNTLQLILGQLEEAIDNAS